VNKQGQVVERYSSLTKPEEIKEKIEELLKA
jgi:glutathione peroxidase-family protein